MCGFAHPGCSGSIRSETHHSSDFGNGPVETLPSMNDTLRRPRGRRGVSSQGVGGFLRRISEGRSGLFYFSVSSAFRTSSVWCALPFAGVAPPSPWPAEGVVMRWGRLYGHVVVNRAVPHGDRSRPETRPRSDLGNRPVETLPSMNENVGRPRGRRGVSSSQGRSAPSTRHLGRFFAAVGAQADGEQAIRQEVSPEKRVPNSVAAPSRGLCGDKFPLPEPFSGFASSSSGLKSS